MASHLPIVVPHVVPVDYDAVVYSHRITLPDGRVVSSCPLPPSLYLMQNSSAFASDLETSDGYSAAIIHLLKIHGSLGPVSSEIGGAEAGPVDV